MLTFVELCDKYPDTDKDGTGPESCHAYGDVYERLFADRLAVRSLLEVGVRSGGSLKVWRDFFPNCTVFGLDNGSERGMWTPDADRITVEYADSHIPTTLAAAGVRHGPFDVIVDDGSHHPYSQIATYAALRPFLKSGGVYVFEDLQQFDDAERIATMFGGQVFDRRPVKGRYDDVLVVFRAG
jgi:hypothetical protein